MDLPILNAKQSAHCYAVGVLCILFLGTISLIALCFIAIWAVVQACATIVLSLIATLDAVQTAYSGLNPIMQLVTMIIVVGVPLLILARNSAMFAWLKGA